MNRLLSVIVLLFGLLLPAGAQAPNNAVSSEVNDRPAIFVGMTGKELYKLMREHGCEDITDNVGILPLYTGEFVRKYDKRHHWIIIPGNTCLFIQLVKLKGKKDFKIHTISKGPDGKGYGGKRKWLEFKVKAVSRIELPDLKKTEQDGNDQPATAPESKRKGDEKSNPESKVRSQ
jgi:hypothetical protein